MMRLNAAELFVPFVPGGATAEYISTIRNGNVVVVEIVDAQDRIDAFLPVLDSMMTSGLVTIEKVQVLQYGDKKT